MSFTCWIYNDNLTRVHTRSPAIERGFFLPQIGIQPLRGGIMRVQVRMCARDQIQARVRVYPRVDLRERAHIWADALHIYARLF